MIQRIRDLLAKVPFHSFIRLTSAAKSCRVSSTDHADISPGKTPVPIWFYDEGATEVAGLHIAAVEYEPAVVPSAF